MIRKSIKDMFFEGTTRISTYLIGVDLLEHAPDSWVRRVVLRRALQFFHELLVPDLPQSAPPAPLRQILFACEALVVDEEEIHLRLQSNEHDDRLALHLVLEFAKKYIV